MDFEVLLQEHRAPLERCIRYRVPPDDADDVMQEVLIAAYRGFPALKDVQRFKPWLMSIASHKCTDYLRRKYRLPIPVEEVPLGCTRLHASDSLVEATLEALSPADAALLRQYYFDQLPISEVALRLEIPQGTVKSRLHAARERFRAAYPISRPELGRESSVSQIRRKDETAMKHSMPDFMPKYTITRREDAPFPVKWEELMGWFVIPRLGEELTWAMYDDPDGHRTEVDHMRVTGRAAIHGIEGVEIAVETLDAMENNQISGETNVTRSFVAQLTDTHCRILAETHTVDGVKRIFTFLDGDAFLDNWGFGEDNCGNETHLVPKGDIRREGDVITHADKPFLLDVVGRCDVHINGKTYDTVCVMDVSTYVEGMATEQYIDREGRTVLWRRFNRDDWRMDRYGKPWTQMLPDSPRITVMNQTYVHWYDCITSHIL